MSDGSVERQGYEINYMAVECGIGEFMCLDSGQCLPGHLQCNNEQDCEDWSDEDIELCGEVTLSLHWIWMIPYVLSCILLIAGCDQNYTAPLGTMTSPYYPNMYPSNTECVHFISQVKIQHIIFKS